MLNSEFSTWNIILDIFTIIFYQFHLVLAFIFKFPKNKASAKLSGTYMNGPCFMFQIKWWTIGMPSGIHLSISELIRAKV
jgi:hypothetical protein